MSQHDLIISDAAGATVRADINDALQALGTLSSGATEPSIMYARMWWADTANSLLKIRNGSNTAWITVAALQTAAYNPIISTYALAGLPAGATGELARVSDDAGALYMKQASAWQPALALPPGVMLPYGGSTAPNGYLLCDGSAVSQASYPALYAIIGLSYGNPGGGNFNLPNLKGRIPVGRDSGQTEFDVLGETGGAKTHTLITGEMPAHGHGVTDAGHVHYMPNLTAGAVNRWTLTNYDTVDWTFQTATSSSTTGISIQNAGGGGAHNNLQPYLIVNYIIKT